MIIYKTTNLINGKIYIGKDTKNNPTYLGSGKILCQSIKKYGIDNFRKDIIEECTTKEMLDEREKYWIDLYSSTERNIGYNISLGGEGGDTISNHPDKDRISKKHSEWMKENNPFRGKKRSKESIEKWRESYGDKWRCENSPNYGSERNVETKQKQSEIRKKWWDNLSNDERTKLINKISKANTGKESPLKGKVNKKHSEWMKENNPFRGKTHTDEVKQRISEANKKPKSEETKRKLSEANKGKKPGNMVKIEIDGIVYDSLTDASIKNGINISTLRNRIKSKNPKYVNYKRYE